jgi:hypothetical protein
MSHWALDFTGEYAPCDPVEMLDFAGEYRPKSGNLDSTGTRGLDFTGGLGKQPANRVPRGGNPAHHRGL